MPWNQEDKELAAFAAVGVVAGAMTGFLLWSVLKPKQSEAPPSSADPCKSPPPVTLGPVGGGYRPASSFPSAATALAASVLGSPYGTTQTATIDGVNYLARSEPHCDDHAGGGKRWHPGGTLYQQ